MKLETSQRVKLTEIFLMLIPTSDFFVSFQAEERGGGGWNEQDLVKSPLQCPCAPALRDRSHGKVCPGKVMQRSIRVRVAFATDGLIPDLALVSHFDPNTIASVIASGRVALKLRYCCHLSSKYPFLW